MRRAFILFSLALACGLPLAGQTISAGQILVATRSLDDPSFAKTVILLIHAEKEGVVGLMLNRRVDHTVSEVLPGAKSGKEPAWLGGVVPVGIFALAGESVAPAGSTKIMPGVFLVTERKQLERMQPSPNLRIYAGNCGWTLAQLRNEMRLGAWRLVPGSADAVFDRQPESLWDRLVSSEFVKAVPALSARARRRST